MVNHIFVGIDLGDKNSVARIAVNRDKTERLGFVNSRRGRERLFEEVKRRAEKVGEGKIVMAYEASSCGFILCDEATARGIQCWVLAPTKMEKSVEQRKHKNDDRDADDVVEKLRGHVLAGNRLPTVWIPDAQMRDDRELIRGRVELVEKQTRLKTQIQMLVKRHGLEKQSGLGTGWTIRYRQWLEALTDSDALGGGARTALKSLLRQLSFLEDEIERMEKPIQQLAEQPRNKPIIVELTSEHGVGLMTAMVYRTEIGYAGRFRRGRQVGKFVGLTPTSHESGQQQDRKGHISRQGPPRLRKMLCQASWVHVLHDPQAKQFYQQLVLRNPKKKKIAIVAVMRRLAVRLWHRMRQAELRITGLAQVSGENRIVRGSRQNQPRSTDMNRGTRPQFPLLELASREEFSPSPSETHELVPSPFPFDRWRLPNSRLLVVDVRIRNMNRKPNIPDRPFKSN